MDLLDLLLQRICEHPAEAAKLPALLAAFGDAQSLLDCQAQGQTAEVRASAYPSRREVNAQISKE